MARLAWFEDCWEQQHIYLVLGPDCAPHLSIWTLKREGHWEETRKYLHPAHVALQEQARRYVAPYNPAEWYY